MLMLRSDAIVSIWRRWRKNVIVSLMVTFVVQLIWALVITPFIPATYRLLNISEQGNIFLNTFLWTWVYSFLAPLLIAAIIIGVLAQWQVIKAQDKVKMAEDKINNLKNDAESWKADCRWLLDRTYTLEKEIRASKLIAKPTTKKRELKAFIELEQATPEMIKVGEIENRFKK